MVAIKLARFPRYSRQQITLQNLLTTRRPVFTLEIAQEALNLSLGPLFDSSFDSPFDPSGLPHHIALSVGNASAWLSLSKELLGTLTSPWAIGDEALPPALHEAVLSAALSPLLRVLRTVLGARISVRDDAQPPADGALRLGLWETGQAAGSPCALLYLDAATATQLNASLESMAGVAGWTNWPTLAVEFTLNAGQMPVSAQELATLENNDILLLPAQISASTHEFILRQRHRALATGRLEGRQLLINRLVETPMSDNMSDNMSNNRQANADESQALADPKALEITLRFDLGQLTLPLGELQQIQPGYSFELELPAPGQVRIVAGTQLIGRGELVQIEDRLGVRVTALFKPDHV